MADSARRRAENEPGDLFVDSTCIDCDTCRWMAPETFGRAGEQSAVIAQPATAAAHRRALQALLACPTASIGTASKAGLAEATADFPLPIQDAGPIFHCGFHSEKSFGATSYLVVRDDGNVLVDVPRFVKPLADRIAAMGGIRTLFLTHQDDVADHEKWAKRFGCERVIHGADAGALGGRAERVIEGDAPVALASDLTVIPTPGHTAGSACLLVSPRGGPRALFTGDHLAWSARLGHVYAFRSACWYRWDLVIESTRRLLPLEFEWLLPGHGRRCRFEPAAMQAQLRRAIAWMETNAPDPD